MTLTLAVTLIVALDVVMLALLAAVMTRPLKLTRHTGEAARARRLETQRAQTRSRRAAPRWKPILD